MNPGGHLQMALWLFTVHSAVGAQGLSLEQGFIQARFLQAWLKAHSSSLAQPISIGAAKLEKFDEILLQKEKIILPLLTYFITANNSISCVAFKTNATHGSGGSCRMDSTICICDTGRYGRTGIYTSISATWIIAYFKGWTININATILFIYNWFRS